MNMEEEKEKNTSPVDYEDLQDWEYDGQGIKRQKKAFHLKWEDRKETANGFVKDL